MPSHPQARSSKDLKKKKRRSVRRWRRKRSQRDQTFSEGEDEAHVLPGVTEILVSGVDPQGLDVRQVQVVLVRIPLHLKREK